MVFISEKNWLEQGWLVALVMMSMLPFMGIGAAPWNEEKSLVVSEFCWRFLAILGDFCCCWGSFRFVGWLVPFKGRDPPEDLSGRDFLMRNFSHPLANLTSRGVRVRSVQVGLVACFSPPPPEKPT